MALMRKLRRAATAVAVGALVASTPPAALERAYALTP